MESPRFAAPNYNKATHLTDALRLYALDLKRLIAENNVSEAKKYLIAVETCCKQLRSLTLVNEEGKRRKAFQES